MSAPQDGPGNIEVRGARVHNLKNVDVSVPLGQLVSIAGVYRSGVSSMALGVLYTEGPRRYLEGALELHAASADAGGTAAGDRKSVV